MSGAAALLALLTLPVWGQTASEEKTSDSVVSITGGPDASGHNYTWIVTNHHDAAITAVAFPHYRADTFTPPAGWTFDITHVLGRGAKEGLCAGKVDSPGAAIYPGKSAEFYLRVAPKGAKRGIRQARVTFKDGREVLVQVETSVREPFLERNMTVVGLGVMFVLFLVGARLRRKPVTDTPAESDNA